MKRIIFPLLLMLFTLTGCSFDNTSIINREKIVIGFDESFAPMGFRNKEGEIVGFDIDLPKRRRGVWGLRLSSSRLIGLKRRRR